MKVYLLNPPYFPRFNREARWQNTGRGGTLYYPIWLSYAAGLLELKHKIRLVDAPAWDWNIQKVLKDIKKFNPEILVVETSPTSLDNDIKISKEIKKEFEAPLVMVGPPAFIHSEKMLEVVDIVAQGEYVFTLREIADKMEGGGKIDDISGISFKKNRDIIHNPPRPSCTSEELNKLPFVSKVYKKHLNCYDYFLSYSLYPVVQIFTGAGCPYQCTFCSWPHTFTGRKYRVRSIENILDEMEWIENNMPEVKDIFFEDDTFTIDKKRVVDFCREYLRRKLTIPWSCNARADTLDLKTMKEMEKANCRFLVVGFESANDEILKNIKKGFTVEQARTFVKNIKKTRLMLHADFIIGLPGETKKTIKNTERFIKWAKPEMLQVSVVSPFPGTELYKWLNEKGYLLTDNPNNYLDEDGHQKAIISYPNLTNKDIVKEVDRILKAFYFSPNYIFRLIKQIFRKHSYYETGRIVSSAISFMRYIKTRLY